MKITTFFTYACILCILWSCDKDQDDNTEKVASITKQVNAIAIDNNNTKWIATESGLYKSVEEGFESVKLTNAGSVLSLYYEKSKETLWLGTETGLVSATISDGKIVETVIANDKLKNSKVMSFYFEDESKKWFGTQAGIGLNNGEAWKKENFRVNAQGSLFKMPIEDFAINSIAHYDGDYFFATSGLKLFRAFDYDKTVDAFSGATQWDPPYNGESITDTMYVVFVDKDGKQWMGGKAGIQVHTGHDPKDPDSFTYFYDELPDSYVLAINQAPNGNIWVGTRKGICIFDGTNWETITNSLPDLCVYTIAFEENGTAWIGTKSGLVSLVK